MENEIETTDTGEEPESETVNHDPQAETDGTENISDEPDPMLPANNDEAEALSRALNEAKEENTELAVKLSQAVTAYRTLVAQMNPAVLAEMITGDTVEEIDQSLAGARAVMEKARREIEADAARARVPAGAPQRTPPDVSALTAREKIQFGLGSSTSKI